MRNPSLRLNDARSDEEYQLLRIGRDGAMPEQVAEDYDVPVEAVYESIRYCQENEDVLDQDREMELASIRAHGWDKPPHAPPGYKPE